MILLELYCLFLHSPGLLPILNLPGFLSSSQKLPPAGPHPH